MSKGPATRTLTIFLAKPGVAEDELLAPASLRSTAIRARGQRIGTFYSRSSEVGVPAWTSFFGNTIDPAKLGLRAASASAVLVVPVKDRLFAITFGYGRAYVERARVEESFGLKVALNSVDEGNIRSIDRKTFEGLTTHVREQASKEGGFGDFGLNVERDLLRAVVGTPADPDLGKRMAGMDALSATAKVELAALPDLLNLYLNKASDASYKSKYPWIDNIAEVRDLALVDKLNTELVEQLRAQNLDRKWLAVPDMMAWHDVGGFSYSAAERASLVDDVHLDEYLGQLRKVQSLDLDTLKRHRVYVYAASDGHEIDHWPTFKCLYAELDVDGDTYLLNSGQWYRLDREFVSEVDSVVAQVPPTKLQLPNYGAKESEEAFNRRLNKHLADSCLMDRKNVAFGGGKSKVEFCDVLTSKRQLVHVKRYSGSAVLSHLFAQGVVSATAFVSDSEFRKRLNAKLCDSHRIADPIRRPTASQWEVAYVIASQSAGALRLPFFSRVTCRNAMRQLESLGFRVTLTKVQVS